MADDTRQASEHPPPPPINRETLTANPEAAAFSGTQWQGGQAQPYKPPANANLMAGGTEHTAGGKTPEVTVGNALQGGLKWNDFTQLPQRPCVRDALMYGIGSGFAIGGTRAIWRATVWNACSWAVGSFCVGASVTYQYCLYKRQAEKEGMMRAVEILNQKEMEKRAREARREKAREERRVAKEQEQDAQLAALKDAANGGGGKPWWKVW